MSAQPNLLAFPEPAGPVSLTDKYAPRTLADFCGLAKPKEIMRRLADNPYKSSWIFTGDSGTGKTSMARALAESIGAELHHIPSQECDLKNLQRVVSICHYEPLMGHKWSLVLIDEADTMSKAAQESLLSTLDNLPPRTIFIFTCNELAKFAPRFLSRSRVIDFSNYGIQKDAVELLQTVWNRETAGKPSPNLARIVKESNGNIRAALMALELEILVS